MSFNSIPCYGCVRAMARNGLGSYCTTPPGVATYKCASCYKGKRPCHTYSQDDLGISSAKELQLYAYQVKSRQRTYDAITVEETAAHPLAEEGEDSKEVGRGDRTTHSLSENSKDVISGQSTTHSLPENAEDVASSRHTNHSLPGNSEEVVRDHRTLELQKLDEIKAAIQDPTKVVKESIQFGPCAIPGSNGGEVAMQGVTGGGNDMEVDGGGGQVVVVNKLAAPAAPVSTGRRANSEVNVTVRFGK